MLRDSLLYEEKLINSWSWLSAFTFFNISFSVKEISTDLTEGYVLLAFNRVHKKLFGKGASIIS